MIVRQRSPSSPKLSTTQLKHALEKIKQTQLQVLKVLKHEGDNYNPQDLKIKNITENIDANMPYIRSISHINLLKMSEIESMRKQSQREKQKNRQNIQRLMSKIKELQDQLRAKSQSQISQARSNKKVDSKNQINDHMINKQAIQTLNVRISNYEKQLHKKNQQIQIFKSREIELQKRKNEILKDKQYFQSKYQEALQEKQFQKMAKTLKSDIPQSFYPEIKRYIKKMAQVHDKMYQNFKQKARIYRIDLQIQESFKQSYSKAIKKLQQYEYNNNEDKPFNNDESIVKQINISRQQSSQHINIVDRQLNQEVQELKKLNINLQHENELLKNQIGSLKEELLLFKEQTYQEKIQYQDYIQKIVKQHEQKQKTYKEKEKLQNNNKKQTEQNQYKDLNLLVQELQKQKKTIQQQKALLSTMYKQVSSHALRSSSSQESKTLKENLLNIIEINDQLRKQNEAKFKENNLLKIQLQKQKYEKSKLQEKIEQRNRFIDKQGTKFRFVMQNKDKLQHQIREKHVSIVKKQEKIKQLGQIIDGNIMKYEKDMKMKSHEINTYKMQIDKNAVQLRSLRQIAFNHQMTIKENDFLKNKIYQVNSNIIHLWQVKQAQYQNIFKVLQVARNSH